MWDAGQYSLFRDERTRPFHDLMARVPVQAPSAVVDLGCGTGDLTAGLAQRWPHARVWGVDNSAQMLRAALAHAIDGRLSFELGDLATWRPPQPLDLIVANASLHWVSDHAAVLQRLTGFLAPGGALAVQQPANFDSPSHLLMQDLCTSPRWAAKLSFMTARRAPVQTAAWYVEHLVGLGLAAEVWETLYQHLLQGPDPVLEWVSGTALRPVLAALEPAEQSAFRDEYAAALLAAYPARSFGTLFPFRRIFFVASKPPAA